MLMRLNQLRVVSSRSVGAYRAPHNSSKHRAAVYAAYVTGTGRVIMRFATNVGYPGSPGAAMRRAKYAATPAMPYIPNIVQNVPLAHLTDLARALLAVARQQKGDQCQST